MSILKFSTGVAVFAALGISYILYSPNLLDFEAQDFTIKYVNYDGALSFNNALDESEIIASGDVLQPESIAYKDGKFYASLSDGRIVILENDKVSGTLINLSAAAKKSARPLGLRIFKNDLYIADGLLGLIKVDIKTGTLTTLLSGSEVVLADDLDIDDKGVIYLSDMTTKWNLHDIMYGLYGRANDGRVIAYDTKTGKKDVLIENLYAANGVQLTHDKQALLITETNGRRIIKYYLDGPRKGTKELFCVLPGEPDNIRPSSNGGYWVVLAFSSTADNPHPMDYWTSSPTTKKIVARLSHMAATGLSFINKFVSMPILQSWEEQLKSGMHFLSMYNLDRPTIIELDTSGNIVRSLQSDKSMYSLRTQALEVNGNLYIGSFVYNHILKVKL